MTDLLEALGGEWAPPAWEDIAPHDWDHCYLCGARVTSMNQGGSQGIVCDDCAQIDHCTIHEHNPVIERRPHPLLPSQTEVAHCENDSWFVLATHRDDDGEWVEITEDQLADLVAEHIHPHHVSHWGESHEIAAHDGLVRAQERRRARYMAKRTQPTGRES